MSDMHSYVEYIDPQGNVVNLGLCTVRQTLRPDHETQLILSAVHKMPAEPTIIIKGSTPEELKLRRREILASNDISKILREDWDPHYTGPFQRSWDRGHD